MKFAAAGSQESDLKTALASITDELRTSLAGAPADLTFVFVSHHHFERFPDLAEQVQALLPSQVLLGASAETVVIGPQEWEAGPAVALWTASLPEYRLQPFTIEFESTPDGVISSGIPDTLGDDVAHMRGLLVLGEPYTSAPHAIIERFSDDCPGIPVIGGMASGASGPGENRLFFGETAISSGAVAVALRDGPTLRTVVSQGCRPIGETFVVTRAERNIILELGGRPALARVQEVYQSASPDDRRLLESGLHLGLAMSEYRDSFGRGDFLVSNVLGADRGSGAIATGMAVRMGQTVQFHIRDAASAADDLTQLLARMQSSAADCAAGLLFSCNGRGTRMFPKPHHDASAIQQSLGPLPLAGMFAAGEIGPVGANSYLHGYTASAVFFAEP